MSAAVYVSAGRLRAGTGALVGGLLALLVALTASAQGGSGGLAGPAPPSAKAASESLTYDNFSGGSCSQGGFVTGAVGHLGIAGAVIVEGATFLDGKPYDTYTLDLGVGPATFGTEFFRTFSPPPPPSHTYRFVYSSSVRQGDREFGRSITTIDCTNGTLSASNAWVPRPEPVPAGSPAAWAALALLLLAAGHARLRAGRR